MARRSTSRDVSSTKENNGTPDSSPQEDRRGALLQRMGALLQRKTHVSTRRIGHADDADCTGSYLRLDRLAPFWRGVWIPIQFICASSHRQPRSARPGLTGEPPYAGYGSRDEEPRHRPSTDATAGGRSPSQERATAGPDTDARSGARVARQESSSESALAPRECAAAGRRAALLGRVGVRPPGRAIPGSPGCTSRGPSPPLLSPSLSCSLALSLPPSLSPLLFLCVHLNDI
jgi:hypothetical protein